MEEKLGQEQREMEEKLGQEQREMEEKRGQEQRELEEKRGQEQREMEERQIEREIRKLQKIRKDAISHIKLYEEKMRLWDVMDYFHKVRLVRIESEEYLDDFFNENKEEEKKNEDTKSRNMKDECNKKQDNDRKYRYYAGKEN
ncbi:hypothetical protein BgiBS90_020844 [Biomphalaria glabrata]|nr:hypothetical protein BgiBS90_020844 [Biomphalaria glabrata]